MYPLFTGHAIWREYINFYSTSNTAKLLLYINLAIFKIMDIRLLILYHVGLEKG